MFKVGDVVVPSGKTKTYPGNYNSRRPMSEILEAKVTNTSSYGEVEVEVTKFNGTRGWSRIFWMKERAWIDKSKALSDYEIY